LSRSSTGPEETAWRVSRYSGLGHARPVGGEGPLADIGDLPEGGILSQAGNSCGTCSLSAVLRHFGIEVSPREIDREIRNANIYTAPSLMVEYARKKGLEAAFFHEGSVEELKDFIRKDVPVVLALDVEREGLRGWLELHYVTAISFSDEDGFRLGIYNPWGLREEITGEELARAWDDVLLGPFSCWRSPFVAIAPAGTGLGAGRDEGARGMNLLSLGIANAVNGFVHLLRDRRPGGLVELASSVPQAPAGAAIYVLEQLARRRR
jgi:hypothetical protein